MTFVLMLEHPVFKTCFESSCSRNVVTNLTSPRTKLNYMLEREVGTLTHKFRYFLQMIFDNWAYVVAPAHAPFFLKSSFSANVITNSTSTRTKLNYCFGKRNWNTPQKFTFLFGFVLVISVWLIFIFIQIEIRLLPKWLTVKDNLTPSD